MCRERPYLQSDMPYIPQARSQIQGGQEGTFSVKKQRAHFKSLTVTIQTSGPGDSLTCLQVWTVLCF